MNKVLVNISFGAAFLIMIVAFVTATTYTQLSVAIILYPLIIYLAYEIFSRGIWNIPYAAPAVQTKPQIQVAEGIKTADKSEKVEVTNIDKRIFLKLLGATGLSFFLISIFGRRVEALLFGQNLVQSSSPFGNNRGATNASSQPTSPTDGYTISEIDDSLIGYYGFINQNGGWFIMKRDTNSGSFRYTKGSTDFPGNWKRRQDLKYDYFHNVFVY